jgi:hypothetical protein
MATNATTAEKRTDTTSIERHGYMGVDQHGRVHHRAGSLVYVITPAGDVERVVDLDDHPGKGWTDWMGYVADERGWEEVPAVTRAVLAVSGVLG